MKKLFQFACVAAMAAAFAACGNGAANNENTDTTAIEMSETIVIDSVAVDSAACCDSTAACDSAAVAE